MMSPFIPTNPSTATTTRTHIERGRRTAPSNGQRFRQTLSNVASTVVSAASQASGLSFASLRLTQASSGQAGSSTSSSYALGSTPGSNQPSSMPSPSDPVSSTANDAQNLIEMQVAINAEQRSFTAASNVLKSRHDTAKAVINNVS